MASATAWSTVIGKVPGFKEDEGECPWPELWPGYARANASKDSATTLIDFTIQLHGN